LTAVAGVLLVLPNRAAMFNAFSAVNEGETLLVNTMVLMTNPQ
jgi:hypothetical protein